MMGFLLTKETTDNYQITHKRYQQYYKGIKVEGAEYLVHLKNGNVEIINGNFQDIVVSIVIPTLNVQQALSKALSFVKAKKYKWEDDATEKFLKQNTNNLQATYYPKAELVIAKDFLMGSKSFKLCYKFTISSLQPNNEQLIFVDAATGDIINSQSLISDANTPCTAQTRYSGNVAITGDSYTGGFRLREIRNGVNVQTLNSLSQPSYANAIDFSNNNTNWITGSWTTIGQNQVALDAHWAEESVLDFWRTIFNRNSINGNGINVVGYVHFFDANSNAGWPNNAQWDGTNNAMRYGDGDGFTFRPLTSLDVVGHEFGHGITQYTAQLNVGSSGVDEAAALNEGFSDIWGACVENFVAPTKQTWLIGEEIMANGSTCLRNMQNPKSNTAAEGQHPNTYHGNFWRNDGEPHNNSTVLSHWFFLVSQGGNGTNDIGSTYNVVGIGINNARQIAYLAEANYIHSGATYATTRTATIQAARDLNNGIIGSCAEMAVTNAWYAVGVGGQYVQTTNLSINGTTLICNTSDYSITNIPAGATVTWSIPSSAGTVLQLAQNTPSINKLRITNQKFYSVTTTLTAVITNAGVCPTIPITFTKTIANDNNTSSSANYGYYQEACDAGVHHNSQSGTTSGATFVHSGCTVYVTLGDLTGKSVSFVGSIQPLMWAVNSTGMLIFQLPLNAGGIPFTFKISGAGACYDQQMLFFVYSNNGRYAFTTTPNPVTSVLNVTAKETEELLLESKIRSTKSELQFKMNIYDANTNALQMIQTSSKGISQHKINTSQLKTGYYILQIVEGDQIQSMKFFKQ